MKKILFYFILLISITEIHGQSSQNLNEKGKVLSNQQSGLFQLTGVSNIIDSDSESYWAYEEANSLIRKIKLDGNNYEKDLSKIYSSYSLIFYGMSYSRAIMALSRGDDYSLEELSSTILDYEDNKAISKYELSKKEIAAIYGMINFYKVSRMPKYSAMNEVYNRYETKMDEIFRLYNENDAYKIASLQNKKLFYKTFVNLIIDLYFVNNPTTEETIINKYFKNVTLMGVTLDKMPNDYNKILNLSDKEYFDYLISTSQIQKEMIQLLIIEIKKLAS